MSAIPATRTTPRHRTGTRTRAKSNTGAVVLGRFITFVVLSSVTYLGSSMAGQVMVEKARREGIVAQRRAREAKRSEAGLRSRINELTGFTNLESWATAHGFIAADQPQAPSLEETTRVAKLD